MKVTFILVALFMIVDFAFYLTVPYEYRLEQSWGRMLPGGGFAVYFKYNAEQAHK